MIWHEFKALGTDIIFLAEIGEEQRSLFFEAENVIRDFEHNFSRFIGDSELSKFNESSAETYCASETLSELLSQAQKYFTLTAGIFDPTIIQSLELIGYDKSFELIGSKDEKETSPKISLDEIRETFWRRPKFNQLKVKGQKITRPSGLRVDFGGIGKGYIVDYLAKNNFKAIQNFWISAGGDILAQGNSAEKIGWDIGIQNPWQPLENITSINTRSEKLGIATSGIIKRRGENNGIVWNHLIDPRSGLPVENNILSVTLIAAGAMRADIFAKTVLILGMEAGLALVEQESDLAAVIFTKDERRIYSSRFPKYLNTYEKTKYIKKNHLN